MVLAPTPSHQLSHSPSIATASSTPAALASHQTTYMALTLIILTPTITTLAERPAGPGAGHATHLRGRHIMGQRPTILQSRLTTRPNRHTLHLRPPTNSSITSMASSPHQVLIKHLNLLLITQLMISTTLGQIWSAILRSLNPESSKSRPSPALGITPGDPKCAL